MGEIRCHITGMGDNSCHFFAIDFKALLDIVRQRAKQVVFSISICRL